jgi:hypothetical protein
VATQGGFGYADWDAEDNMTCQHLRQLEEAIIASGLWETYRGQAWTTNCREWVYFKCYLDQDKIRQKFDLPPCVIAHANSDAKSGREAGFVCTECHDGIMGVHRDDAAGQPSFPALPQPVSISACLLCYGTLVVGEISDIAKCDPSCFGNFQLRMNPADSAISKRICEFIDFTREDDRKMGQDQNYSPDASDFAQFDDIVHSGAWVVKLENGDVRGIERPYFMDDGQVTWQFSQSATAD